MACVESLEGYLLDLGSAKPTPGGGSAAAIAASLGSALVGMVSRITLQSARLAERHDLASRLAEASDTLGTKLVADRAADEAAFAGVMAAMALPKQTPDEKAARTARLQRALAAAAEAPLETARDAIAVLRLADGALGLHNENLNSDVGCAAEFASAALLAAAYNVRVNHVYMKDAAVVAAQAGALDALEAEGTALLERVRSALRAPQTR